MCESVYVCLNMFVRMYVCMYVYIVTFPMPHDRGCERGSDFLGVYNLCPETEFYQVSYCF